MKNSKSDVSLRVIVQAFLFVVLLPFLPLLISTQWRWWEGWLYGGLGVISFVISRILAARQNPDLISERAKFMQHEDTQTWDKKIISSVGLIGIVSVVVAGLDRLFAWTPTFNLWVRILGLFLLITGYIFSSYALVINRFFSGMVRLQRDRGQYVVSKGPYSWVRHPGYAGGILAYLATPLLLNSVWMAIPICVTIGLFIIRTFLEDKFLVKNLQGYAEYADRVKYRLIPGLW